MTKRAFYALILCMAVSAGADDKTYAQDVNDNESSSCTQCHGNTEKMKALGYPEFALTGEDVERQSGMTASCEMCHLGTPGDDTVSGAHKSILGLSVVMKKGSVAVSRRELKGEDRESVRILKPKGSFAGNALFPRITGKDGKVALNPRVNVIQWHDKDLNTVAFNPGIAEKTCGTCHAREVKTYSETEMGSSMTMSQYVTWSSPTGPQSCGLWTAAAAKPDNSAFSTANLDAYNAASTAHLGKEQAFSNQRNCNSCHAGCLDCHYAPFSQEAKDGAGKPLAVGVHTFSSKPATLSCMGGGRAQLCHAGALERRRGDGFMKGEFASKAVADPQNENSKKYIETPDVHFAKGVSCIDCHRDNHKAHSMGDQARNPEPEQCSACHKQAVSSHGQGIHRKLSCEACHTPLVAGYAFNFWAPGTKFGMETPLDRHQFYNVNAMQPIILKSGNGQWNPYHVVPHIATNVKPEKVELSRHLIFRSRPDVDMKRQYPSNDAFAVTGFYAGSKDEGTVMAWLNVDKVAHATSSARSCDSCHGLDGAQAVFVDYQWMDKPDAAYQDVLSGHYTIAADKKGLRIDNLSGSDSKKSVPAGLKSAAGNWSLQGDFSIPRVNSKAYAAEMERSRRVTAAGGTYH
jgi:cytochrome c553